MAVVAKGGTLPDTGVTKNEVYALVDSATVSNIVIADVDTNAAIVDTKLATISTAGKVSGAALTSLGSIPSGAGTIPTVNAPGKIVQVVNTETGAVATGSTLMVLDDSIPQKTEGNEFMTLAITPTSATNKLLIDVVWVGCSSNNSLLIGALFQDTNADAIAATQQPSQLQNSMVLRHYMTAGTTSATTFKFRVGDYQAGTVTFNGSASARQLGGVMASSITITEIAA